MEQTKGRKIVMCVSIMICTILLAMPIKQKKMFSIDILSCSNSFAFNLAYMCWR